MPDGSCVYSVRTRIEVKSAKYCIGVHNVRIEVNDVKQQSAEPREQILHLLKNRTHNVLPRNLSSNTGYI